MSYEPVEEGGYDEPLAQDRDLLLAIQKILDDALSHSDCAKVFGDPKGNVTAAQILDSLIAGGDAGSIKFTDQILRGSSGAETSANHPWIRGLVGTASSSTVTISSVVIQDFFNTSTYNAEVTVLHELGHVTSNLNWKNNFKPDSLFTDPEGKGDAANTKLVTDHCGKYLK